MAKKVGYAAYRLSPLKKITDQAKQIRKKNPGIAWADAIKKAGAIYRGEAKAPAAKKAAVKKPAVKKAAPKKKAAVKKISGTANKTDLNFWIMCFAPRTRSWQVATYRELKESITKNKTNVFESRDQQVAQLRALEYIMGKNPLNIK